MLFGPDPINKQWFSLVFASDSKRMGVGARKALGFLKDSHFNFSSSKLKLFNSFNTSSTLSVWLVTATVANSFPFSVSF